MAVTEQFSCDVCGKQKQQANHWWVGTETDIGTHKSFVFYPWPTGRREAEAGKKVNHLCGQQCAIKALSEWMSRLSKQAEGAR